MGLLLFRTERSKFESVGKTEGAPRSEKDLREEMIHKFQGLKRKIFLFFSVLYAINITKILERREAVWA